MTNTSGTSSYVLGDSHPLLTAQVPAGRCSGKEGKVPRVHFWVSPVCPASLPLCPCDNSFWCSAWEWLTVMPAAVTPSHSSELFLTHPHTFPGLSKTQQTYTQANTHMLDTLRADVGWGLSRAPSGTAGIHLWLPWLWLLLLPAAVSTVAALRRHAPAHCTPFMRPIAVTLRESDRLESEALLVTNSVLSSLQHGYPDSLGYHQPSCGPASLGPTSGAGHPFCLAHLLLLVSLEPELLALPGEVPSR